MYFDTCFEGVFPLLHKIVPFMTGCLGHSAEPSVVISLVDSWVHMEKTAERNAHFFRLKSFVFRHTEMMSFLICIY